MYNKLKIKISKQNNETKFYCFKHVKIIGFKILSYKSNIPRNLIINDIIICLIKTN